MQLTRNNAIRTTFVFLNWISKKVAVAPATISFPEESTMNNARIRFRTEEFRWEHPAGARCIGSNGETTMTAQTKPVRQFDCRTDYRTVWPTPETRLADWVECPCQNNNRSFWMNRRDSSHSSSSSDVLRLLLCVFLTWFWFYEEFVR